MKMRLKQTGYIVILLTCCYISYGRQVRDSTFSGINNLLAQKSFVRAQRLYQAQQKELPAVYRYYIEARLSNAFNKLSEAEKMINNAIRSKNRLPDSLMVQLWKIRKDNAIKRYRYKEAAAATRRLLQEYAGSFDQKQISDLENDLRLWGGLANVPAQQISVKDNTTLRLVQDKAGLKNIKAGNGSDSMDLIFDTGANISTITRSAATKMGLTPVPASIRVGSITGKEVNASLAVWKKLFIGNMEISNAVFLVFDDADLSFPQIDYQINGILGYPVIEAMKEITITRDGFFSVPKQPTGSAAGIKMAMNELIPVVFMEDNPYTFDTGADNTILYQPYFLSRQESITRAYQPGSIGFGGAGGSSQFNGYNIDAAFDLAGRTVHLKGITLITDDIGKDKGIYGNIGQDVIKQFRSMTLSFETMFIRFD